MLLISVEFTLTQEWSSLSFCLNMIDNCGTAMTMKSGCCCGLVDVVVAGWNHINAEGERKPVGEVIFCIHRHMCEFGSMKEQPSS